ncbi:ATP-dependent helicase [Paenibacillus sp. J31TS4]|uniref:helicase C-terminal domain-containing protein n=1 Tax=Paenibacillus sp. J31TS4 TaxID=2807195 RepID=UPI001B0839BC|nr:helicase C-terminal domain-containing protein [Paenibacillus sp. J31TS4]GIP40436.1 ATP-dependent helicase [Paenibacillus sp. J31TS4]
MEASIRISVRTLVEYVYRAGSIEAGFRSASSLVEGTRIHQAVQSGYGEGDRKEVALQTELAVAGLVFVVEGRCDGLLEIDGRLTVEEIKSTAGPVDGMTEDRHPVHWAQAYWYAYLVAEERGLGEMDVRLTYVQTVSDERRSFTRRVPFGELEALAKRTLAAYAPYASLLARHAAGREGSARALAFPYETYREGQRAFAGAVYKSVLDGKRLFAQAPTGTGKTISTLFPAVKAMGEGLLQKLIYATARTTTRAAAEEALARMEERGLRLWAVTLTAKDKICFQEETRCQKELCPYADGHYDRINAALLDLLGSETLITRPVVEAYARKHRVCPFEFSLDAAYAADAIICDYNAVYDPRVSLKRLPEEQKKRTAVLVDEAHNLVDRARDMYSAEIAKSPFLELTRAYKTRSAAVADTAKAVNAWFIALRKESGEAKETVRRELPDGLTERLERFVQEAERELAARPEPDEAQGLLLDTYYGAQSLLRIAELYDDRYVTYAELNRSEVRLKLFCLDPSRLLRKTSRSYRSQICFSATLSPLAYYRDMLGGEEEDYRTAIPSPFRKEQLEVVVHPLSTRFRDRERTKEAIASLVGRVVRERPGNFLVFFPSYDYLRQVYEEFAQAHPEMRTLVQESGLGEAEREAFLARFQAEPEGGPLVGFAVLGGIFSEGIDLRGDRLTGVVVVGVGLPQLGLERNLLRDFYDREGRSGYDYAYVYPGMNKVMQAGGRLIRTEEDQGVLALVDDRFLQEKYRQLMPPEWKPFRIEKETGRNGGRAERPDAGPEARPAREDAD